MRAITKAEYNHLVELFNRRIKADVIGVGRQEHAALGAALKALAGSWEDTATPAQSSKGE